MDSEIVLKTTSSTSKVNGWLEPRKDSSTGKMMTPMQKLFARLDGKYPGSWANKFKNADAIANWEQAWAQTFVKFEITFHELKYALDKVSVAHPTFPPNEGEFLRLCRASVEPEYAFLEAQEQLALRETGQDQWSHRAVYWAAVQFGTRAVREMTWYGDKREHEPAAGPRFTEIYQQVWAMESIPEIPPRAVAPQPAALLEGPHTQVTAEEVERTRKMLASGKSVASLVVSKGEGEAFRKDPEYIARMKKSAHEGIGAVRDVARNMLDGWGIEWRKQA